MSTGWVIGWGVGAVVVLLVVVLLVLMIRGAARAAGKAEAIVAALHDARDHTAGLWRVEATNQTAERIVAAATRAREALTGEGR